jgi:transcriptional repressor NrdR
MRCPKCSGQDDKVIDSRSSNEGGTIRRRRECLKCGHRFTTYEEIERGNLMVIKRDGRRETFSREKLLGGIQRACQKLPISNETILEMVTRVVDQIASEYDSEVPGTAIGEKVMNVLREADEVAYVRFASVYRRFQEATDFVHAVKKLEIRNDTATLRLPGV